MDLRDLLDDFNYYFQGNRREDESAKELFKNVYNHPQQNTKNPVEIPLSTYRKYITGDSMRTFCKNLLPGLSKEKFSKYINSFGDSPKEDLIEDFSEEHFIKITKRDFGEQLATLFVDAIKEEARTGVKRTHKKNRHVSDCSESTQYNNDSGYIDLNEVIEKFTTENRQNKDSEFQSEEKVHQELKVDRFYHQQAQNIININELKELKI